MNELGASGALYNYGTKMKPNYKKELGIVLLAIIVGSMLAKRASVDMRPEYLGHLAVYGTPEKIDVPGKNIAVIKDRTNDLYFSYDEGKDLTKEGCYVFYTTLYWAPQEVPVSKELRNELMRFTTDTKDKCASDIQTGNMPRKSK